MARMHIDELEIDEALVRRFLVASTATQLAWPAAFLHLVLALLPFATRSIRVGGVRVEEPCGSCPCCGTSRGECGCGRGHSRSRVAVVPGWAGEYRLCRRGAGFAAGDGEAAAAGVEATARVCDAEFAGGG